MQSLMIHAATQSKNSPTPQLIKAAVNYVEDQEERYWKPTRLNRRRKKYRLYLPGQVWPLPLLKQAFSSVPDGLKPDRL
jgi:hypothetical protein